MFPSECVLERHVRSGDEVLAATNLPLFILKCKHRKADGYADDLLEIYNQMLQDMVIGVRLADAPPAVSYLAILRSPADAFAEIVAVDSSVIVISLDLTGGAGSLSYLIYDAIALSLRMIPAPDPSGLDPLSSRVSMARPCRGPEYALVHTGRQDADGEGDYLLLWRPSLSSPPWSEYKKARLPDLIDWSVNEIHMEFSFNGHAYWVDLLCGVSYCSCEGLFDDDSSVVKFGGFIRLPVEPGGHDDRFAEPAAYRTMGVVRDSFIRFVSIDGFQDYVELKDRTVTVWRLLGHDKGWEKEHELSLETLWGFEGFGDVPKDLTLMYPLLSTKDTDVVYLVLGEYSEDRFEGEFYFASSDPRYLLSVDMRNRIVRTTQDEEDWFDSLISCGFSRYLRKALIAPCDDGGIPMKKKRRWKKRRLHNIAEAQSP